MDQLDAIEIPEIQGSVDFDNVEFEYDTSEPIFRSVSLTATPGQTVTIVGPTSAGKTTVINLLSRFYDVKKGKVLVD